MWFKSDGTFESGEPASSNARNALCYQQSLDELVSFGRGYNVVTSKERDFTENGTSMQPGWPDAIACQNGAIFWKATDTSYRQAFHADRRVFFNNDGTYQRTIGDSTSACQHRGIQDLYDEGRAYNVVSSREVDPFGLTSLESNWPDALRCDDAGRVFYRAQKGIYRAINRGDLTQHYIGFDATTGEFDDDNLVRSSNMGDGCLGKSIGELYDEGRAFNIVTPSAASVGTYFFDYRVEDLVFEQVDVSGASTNDISSTENGIISNCAEGTTTEHQLELGFSHANTQSLTTTKSFTNSQSTSITAGVSVTVTARANAIFASAETSATASFEYSNSWSGSATKEDSETLETTRIMEFSHSALVQVEGGTCAEYRLFTTVSQEPISVPYTATARLTLVDGNTMEPVVDSPTLQRIGGLFPDSYGAIVDESTNTISFPIEGVYEGLYASEKQTSTTNCGCEGASSGVRMTWLLQVFVLCASLFLVIS